jgi:hypothetical protein
MNDLADPIAFPGWVSIPALHKDRRWDAVMGERIAPIKGIKTCGGAHRFIRQFIRYQPEPIDLWSSPDETLKRGYGDCEDLALLERAILISLGVPSDKIWFVLARDLIARIDHAMLVLDGLLFDSRSDRTPLLAEAKDYSPILAFSDERCVTFGRKRSETK